MIFNQGLLPRYPETSEIRQRLCPGVVCTCETKAVMSEFSLQDLVLLSPVFSSACQPVTYTTFVFCLNAASECLFT